MKWVDFKEIKERVSIRDVLTYYEIQGLKESNGKLIGPCPVHGGDSPTAFHVDLEKNIWHCFTGCHGGGNVLDLVAKKENISIRDAALKLQELFLESPSKEKRSKSEQPPPPPSSLSADTREHSSQPPEMDSTDNNEEDKSSDQTKSHHSTNPPLSFTLNLIADHPYLFNERNLDATTIEHFGLGFCPKGTMAGRIAIPIHDKKGKLVAYVGRRIKDNQDGPDRPKYRFPKGFRKQLLLYNLHRAKDKAKQLQELIIVEGFFDVFHLYQAGYENVVALMGSAMSLEQEGLIRAYCSKVTFFFDGDEAGQNCTEECLWRLIYDRHVRIISMEDGEQPDNLSPTRIRELLG